MTRVQGQGPVDPTASGQAVLVVDDDDQLRNLLCAVLTPLGCEIVSAGSGEAALKGIVAAQSRCDRLGHQHARDGRIRNRAVDTGHRKTGIDADNISHRPDRAGR